MSDTTADDHHPNITQASCSCGQIMRQMIKLAQSLEAASEEGRQRAIMLAKGEAKYIAMTLLTSADHLRMLQGYEPMLPHPPQ